MPEVGRMIVGWQRPGTRPRALAVPDFGWALQLPLALARCICLVSHHGRITFSTSGTSMEIGRSSRRR